MYVHIIHVWYMYLLDMCIYLCMYVYIMNVWCMGACCACIHVYVVYICNCKCKIVKFTQHILQTVTNIGLQLLASGLLKST